MALMRAELHETRGLGKRRWKRLQGELAEGRRHGGSCAHGSFRSRTQARGEARGRGRAAGAAQPAWGRCAGAGGCSEGQCVTQVSLYRETLACGQPTSGWSSCVRRAQGSRVVRLRGLAPLGRGPPQQRTGCRGQEQGPMQAR